MTINKLLAAMTASALALTPALAQANAAPASASKLSVAAAQQGGLRAGSAAKRSKLAPAVIVAIIAGIAVTAGTIVAVSDDDDDSASPS